MTELNFKGKEFVYNHHLAVPFRPLVPHEDKGIGPVKLDGTMVIEGDNLHALKALLPLLCHQSKNLGKKYARGLSGVPLPSAR